MIRSPDQDAELDRMALDRVVVDVPGHDSQIIGEEIAHRPGLAVAGGEEQVLGIAGRPGDQERQRRTGEFDAVILGIRLDAVDLVAGVAAEVELDRGQAIAVGEFGHGLVHRSVQRTAVSGDRGHHGKDHRMVGDGIPELIGDAHLERFGQHVGRDAGEARGVTHHQDQFGIADGRAGVKNGGRAGEVGVVVAGTHLHGVVLAARALAEVPDHAGVAVEIGDD